MPTRPVGLPRATRPLAVIVVLGAALAWRLAILVRTGFAIDGDEGTVGLMALHIARGLERPVFFYGQPYMGALEAYVAALPMAVFGAGAVALKATALAFALATVALGWRLAHLSLGTVAGLGTALYMAVPPFVPAVWSLKLRGGYTSLLALGLGLLLLARHIGTRGATRRSAFAFGALVGLVTWLNLLAFPLVGAAALYLVSRRQLWNRATTRLWAGAGFVLGALPLLLANLSSGGETFAFLLGRDRPDVGPGALDNTFVRHLPMLLGVREPPDLGAGVSAWAVPVLALFALGAALFVRRRRADLSGALRGAAHPTSGAELYPLVAGLYLACALATPYGREDSPRFAVVLHLALAPLVGVTLAWAWEGRGPAVRALAVTGLAALLAFDAHSLWKHFDDRPGDGSAVGYQATDYEAFVGGGSADGLLAVLASHDVDGLAADHFVRHAVAFLSGDRIAPSPPRYPGHAERYRLAERRAWATHPDNRDARFMLPILDGLGAAGVGFVTEQVDGQRVAVLRDTGLPSRDWTAEAGVEPDSAVHVFDRDPRTGWLAARTRDSLVVPQITVDLGRPVDVARLGLLFGIARPAQVTLRPRYLVLRMSLDGATWSEPLTLQPAGDQWSTPLPATRARYLRLESVGTMAITWELLELFVYPV